MLPENWKLRGDVKLCTWEAWGVLLVWRSTASSFDTVFRTRLLSAEGFYLPHSCAICESYWDLNLLCASYSLAFYSKAHRYALGASALSTKAFVFFLPHRTFLSISFALSFLKVLCTLLALLRCRARVELSPTRAGISLRCTSPRVWWLTEVYNALWATA